MSHTKLNAYRRVLLGEPFPREWETWLSANMAHYRLLNDDERARLQDDCRVLVAEKTWEGCDGLKVTDLMKVTVAAQAALLLLGIEHDYFSRVQSVVMFPTAFELPAESWEERAGTALGRAVDYGTVFLSWETVLAEARDPATGHNLVIHEFAHQLDFLDGYTNGTPALRGREQTERWRLVMQSTFQRLRRSLHMGQRTFLGSYAATNATEFFSVVSEKFFSLPSQLRQWHPDLFEVLTEYYRVAPVRWFEKKISDEPAQPTAGTEEQPAQEVQSMPSMEEFDTDFIDFTCPYCGNPVSFPRTDAGALKQCPTCLESMLVPASTRAPAQRIPFPIKTARLVLRHLQAVDVKDVADLLSNAETLKYAAWNPMSLDEVDEWITRNTEVGFPHTSKSCYLAIDEIQAAKVIGLADFWFVHDDFDLVQFEIIIHPNWQGKGYATEAARSLLAYAFAGLHVRRIIAVCDARNLPARRFLLKAGLRQESECRQDLQLKKEWVDSAGFALLRREFEQQASGATAGALKAS